MKFFVVLMLIGLSLEANYCVQVLTANESERSSIVKRASSPDFAQFNDVRVESRGHYLVFRIGDYESYKDASRDISLIKEITSDAYVRKCDFVREKAVFIANESDAEVQESYYQREKVQRESVVKSKPRVVKVKKAPKREYKQKEELTYSYSDEKNSLWGDCKKCFIPVYEEEEEEIEYNLESPKVSTPTVKRERVKKVKVRVNKPELQEESFWAEDIPLVEESTPKVKSVKKSRNKFNIDEQFLP